MTVQEHEPWRGVIGLVELMHATVGSRSAEFGVKNIARGVRKQFILHDIGVYHPRYSGASGREEQIRTVRCRRLPPEALGGFGEMHKNGGIDRGKGRENPLKFVKI